MFTYEVTLENPADGTTLRLLSRTTSHTLIATSAEGDELRVTLISAKHFGDGGTALIYFTDSTGTHWAVHVSPVLFDNEPVAQIARCETRAEQTERRWEALTVFEKEFFVKPEPPDPEVPADYDNQFDPPNAQQLVIKYLELGGTRYV